MEVSSAKATDIWNIFLKLRAMNYLQARSESNSSTHCVLELADGCSLASVAKLPSSPVMQIPLYICVWALSVLGQSVCGKVFDIWLKFRTHLFHTDRNGLHNVNTQFYT